MKNKIHIPKLLQGRVPENYFELLAEATIKKMRRLREIAGKTPMEIDRELNKPLGWLHHFEAGEQTMEEDDFREMCELYKINPEEFIAEIENGLSSLIDKEKRNMLN